ncbi:MAG: EF-hand domain-containing protein [Rhodoferax sp.]|nr:EF-hand domain-containing protein [Rhodoferax sp.]
MVSSISIASGKVVMPPPPMKPEDAFKKIDSTNKGFITETELASAIVQFSPEGMSLSKADAQSVAKEAITKMDANTDGKVTSAEFKDAAPKNSPNGGPPQGRPSGPPPGGPPPGGSAGGPAGAKGANAASSSKSTDPADANQDGTVSETERLAYASKQQTLSSIASINTTSTTTP